MDRIIVCLEKQPTIRNTGLTVADVLRWLGSGLTEQQIRDRYPCLEREDFSAIYNFAAECVTSVNSVDDAFARIRHGIKERLDAVRDFGMDSETDPHQ